MKNGKYEVNFLGYDGFGKYKEKEFYFEERFNVFVIYENLD